MTMAASGIRPLLFLLVVTSPASASAAVEIAFHSRAMGSSFPHAMIVMRGTLDATGERVDSNYGFTVRHQIGPSVLFGSVQGVVASERRNYIAGTIRHFSLQLSDDQYGQVMQLVARWRSLPQPSYHLDRRNCVTFVAAVAAELGLDASPDSATIRRPRAFLERVLRQNRERIAAWQAPSSPSSAHRTGINR